ncbi:MAG: hypothetical protein R3C68_04985 [Myxococcota bacterium]
MRRSWVLGMGLTVLCLPAMAAQIVVTRPKTSLGAKSAALAHKVLSATLPEHEVRLAPRPKAWKRSRDLARHRGQSATTAGIDIYVDCQINYSGVGTRNAFGGGPVQGGDETRRSLRGGLALGMAF